MNYENLHLEGHNETPLRGISAHDYPDLSKPGTEVVAQGSRRRGNPLRPAGISRTGGPAWGARRRHPAARAAPEVGIPMRPAVKASFTLYCEEHVQDFIGQLDGQGIQAWGRAIPVSAFVNALWQSAKREGYVEGHVRAQVDHHEDVHGYEPPASVIGDWRKWAGK